jgi:hypothetical protein
MLDDAMSQHQIWKSVCWRNRQSIVMYGVISHCLQCACNSTATQLNAKYMMEFRMWVTCCCVSMENNATHASNIHIMGYEGWPIQHHMVVHGMYVYILSYNVSVSHNGIVPEQCVYPYNIVVLYYSWGSCSTKYVWLYCGVWRSNVQWMSLSTIVYHCMHIYMYSQYVMTHVMTVYLASTDYICVDVWMRFQRLAWLCGAHWVVMMCFDAPSM